MHPVQLAAAAAALFAADRAGVLQALRQPTRVEDLAAQQRLDARGLQTVLEVLRANGLLARRDDGAYAASEPLVQALGNRRATPGYWADLFGHTGAYLQTGRAHDPRSGETAGRAGTYPDVVHYLADLFEGPALTLAAALGPLPPCARILDVGAGSAVWSLAQLDPAEGPHLTALDLEAVLPRALERGRRLGLDAHMTLYAADYLVDPLPAGPFDRILLANVLHLEPEERAAALVQRAADVLAPDGQLVVVDALAPATDEEDRAHTAYALYLALRVDQARVHPEDRLREWLGSAGLAEVRRVPLNDGRSSLGALVAAAHPPGVG